MSEQEVRRAWPGVVNALSKPAELAEGARREAALLRAADVLGELALQGMSLDAAPHGYTVAHLLAGYGAGHVKLLNQLYWSNANMAPPSPNDASLPIEVAAMMGHVDAVRRLYAMGCGVARALFCAVRESQLEVIKLLLGRFVFRHFCKDDIGVNVTYILRLNKAKAQYAEC